MNNKVLIIGYGVVGHNLYKEIEKLKPDIYDKYKRYFNTKRKVTYDFAFICVDTPYINKDNVCDLTAVYDALAHNDARIYIIKSTILPGTTQQLNNKLKELGKEDRQVIFSPEYYGGTQHCNNFDFNYTILGGDKQACRKVQQLLQHVYDARHTFHIVDSTTAELAKYMENSWLATKVSFCNQFFDLANKLGSDYETLRELFILDPRVNPSHTFVYEEKPYWDSHCLNKDVPAIAHACGADLLKAVIDFNEARKNKKE